MRPTLIWDLPTRLFHGLFAASFVGAWLSAESDEWLSLHTFFGYLMIGLIGFRLVWGLVGSRYARFSSFLYGPRAGLAYLRRAMNGQAPRHLGHNPAGSQAVFILLGLGLLASISGLFVQGGEEQQGIAAGVLGYAAGNVVKEAHELLANLMLLMVFGHLIGVAFESWQHAENLARSMITGMKKADAGVPAVRSHRLTGLLLVAGVAVFGAGWFFYAIEEPVERLMGHDDAASEGPHVAFVGKRLPESDLWKEECDSCHQAFHPSLLPARSWQALMAQQDRHFDEDLALDAATVSGLLAFAVPHAADRGDTEAAWKINRSVKAETTPLRITETPYWVRKHSKIADTDWKNPTVKTKINCVACHLDAEAGTYEDAAMRIPR